MKKLSIAILLTMVLGLGLFAQAHAPAQIKDYEVFIYSKEINMVVLKVNGFMVKNKLYLIADTVKDMAYMDFSKKPEKVYISGKSMDVIYVEKSGNIACQNENGSFYLMYAGSYEAFGKPWDDMKFYMDNCRPFFDK